MTQLVHMAADDYFADPIERGSLSSSIAHLLVSRSPRHAWLAHPKLGGKPKRATKTMDRGSLMHRLVLGRGAEIVAVDAEDWRTKAAQQARDEAREAGKIPALLADVEGATEDAAEIHRQLEHFGITLAGESEMVALWTEAADDGTEVACRAMLDHICPPPVIYDLKSCRSAHPIALQRHIIGYGYHIQAHAYQRALAAVDRSLTGRTDFVFLFTELEPAVTVQPARLDGSMRVLGERQWRRAINLWAACRASGTWPGYADGIVNVEAPPWALHQDLDADEHAFSEVG